MGFHLGRLDDRDLRRLLADATDTPLSYAYVGCTKDTTLAAKGYRVDRYGIDLPHDPSTFDVARRALELWAMHTGAGARVVTADAPLTVGQTVVVAIGLPGLTATAPCRIVWVDDEPDRYAFGYGTLIGHPERGEESFGVVRIGDVVRFEIVAVSRPAALLTRLGAPVSRAVQQSMTRRYLEGFRKAVTD
jgi:uncharacterized protein (UPF0548 family)